jgi:hypothetical protein
MIKIMQIEMSNVAVLVHPESPLVMITTNEKRFTRVT